MQIVVICGGPLDKSNSVIGNYWSSSWLALFAIHDRQQNDIEWDIIICKLKKDNTESAKVRQAGSIVPLKLNVATTSVMQLLIPAMPALYSLLTHEFRVVWWYPPPILPCKKEILAIFRNNCQMDIKNATLLAFIFCLCADIEHINMYLPNSRWPHNNFEISLANWLHFTAPLGAK